MEQTTELNCFKITEINESFDEEVDDERYSREYLVEEPDSYDYIFEPGHYAHPTYNHEIVEITATDSSIPKASVSSEEKYQNGAKVLKR